MPKKQSLAFFLEQELHSLKEKGVRRWPYRKYLSFNDDEKAFVEAERNRIASDLTKETGAPWRNDQVFTSWVMRAIVRQLMDLKHAKWRQQFRRSRE